MLEDIISQTAKEEEEYEAEQDTHNNVTILESSVFFSVVSLFP